MYIPDLILDSELGKSPLAIIIVCSILGVLLLVRFYSLIKDGFGLVKESVYESGMMNYSSETKENAAFQLSMFPYFQKLSPRGKDEFIRRTLNFVNTKTIEGADDYEPDHAAKIHVGAAAAQLTFGLPDFSFPDFNTVILYPNIFKLSPNAPAMKGGTTPDGIIRISMKDFDEGFANPTNKLNVGLHELGHAIFMELIKSANEEKDLENQSETNVVRPYLAEADQILNLKKDRTGFLRDYAFTNRHEFFAVAVEHFFEAPQEFREKLPELFSVMKNLLNQDPLNSTSDYAIGQRASG